MMQKLRIAKNISSLPLPSGGWVEVEPILFMNQKSILQKVWITFHHLHLRGGMKRNAAVQVSSEFRA
jgi:hypothetical protein